jgi:hypothetical protein
MTQMALACYLEVNRSQLAMAELHERELPSEAGQKLTRLVVAMNATSPTAFGQAFGKAGQKQDALHAKRARAQLHKAQRALVAAQESLAKLQADHTRVVGLMDSLEILRNNGIPCDAVLCQNLARGAEKLFEKSNPKAQRPLKEKIKRIRAEIKDIKKEYKGKL